ncbi:MAG TPA: NADH-quinone oxidoreductase subunit C, partial [Mycobacterium sp.]|nr:NADH-quinone oxidoreductase subunit C [Mycobacterium sp.]
MTESNGTTNGTGTGSRDAAGREVIDTRRGMFGVSGSGDTSGYGRLVREISLP